MPGDVPRGALYFGMLVRAAAVKKGQAASALTAIVIAAAAATAMVNLFVDVQAKLRKEFRNFGANIVVEAKSGGSFSAEDLAKIDYAVPGHRLSDPFDCRGARGQTDPPIVAAG